MEASERWYCRKLPDGIVIVHARPEFATQMEALQIACFPTLANEERFKSQHYVWHMELFSHGQFVALDGDRVVGATTSLRLNFDFARVDHTFADIIRGGWLTSHLPDGEWLYGADMGVHPEYRGRGLSTALYAARQEVVWRLGLKGQVTAGMFPGYPRVRSSMSVQEYYRRVVSGELWDPTLSVQIKIGFKPLGLIENYLQDPVCDNYGVLMVLDAAAQVRGASKDHAMAQIR